MTKITTRELHAVRTGPRGGTPVVLLHGAGLDLTYWDAQIQAFGDAYDLAAFDLPGHGRTPGTPDDWTLERVTASVAAAVERLNAEPVHLVGLSMGSMISQSVALARPDLIRSLTLIGTAATFPDAGRAALRHRAQVARARGMQAILDEGLISHWFTPAFVTRRPDLLDRAATTLLANDPDVYAAMWDMVASFETLAQLGRVHCPTLIVVGEQDTSTPVPAAEAVRDALPGAHLRIIPHSAHMTPLERPNLVNEHIRTFLTALA